MKKFIAIIAILLIGVSAFAQRGTVQNIATDSLKGNNSSILATIPVTGTYESLFIQVTASRVSTAAGGTFYLKDGIDEAAALVMNQSTNPSMECQPNDTLATTDVATQYWLINITEPGAKNYYLFGDGDANDTLKVSTKIILK
jgi:hypothetical protein